MKMKNVVENLFLLFAIGVIVWIICSYVNIITDKAINYATENMDLEKFARTVEDFDITTAREDLNKWLIEEGIFHE